MYLAPLIRGVGGFGTRLCLRDSRFVVTQFIACSSLLVRIADNTDGADYADRFLIVSGAFEKKDASLAERTGDESPYYKRVFS